MKILFLDVDGVLNLLSTHSGIFSLNKNKLRKLQYIIQQTDAKIVLSSSWRTDRRFINKLSRDLSYRKLYIYSTTPILNTSRGQEIQAWLDNHNNISNYVILDDNNDMLDSQQGNLIFINGYFGIQDFHANKAIKILNKELPC